MNDNKKQGSYRFGTFHDNEIELDRLKKQAAAFIGIEIKNLERAGLKPGQKVLDLGCGPGFISCELAKYVGNGQVMGVDTNDQLLTIADNEKKIRNITNLNFKKSNVYQLDLPKNEFDFVYCRLIFQHLSDPNLALQNIYQVLKPGGIVCIADIDDDFVVFYPEPKGFASLVQRTITNVKAEGGDRMIGRKLYSYLTKSGYRNVNEWLELITSSNIGMKNFVDITCIVRSQLCHSEEEYAKSQAELTEIYKIVDQPDAWGAIGTFIAVGTK